MQPMRYWLLTSDVHMTMRKRPSGESRPLNATLKLHGIEWAYFDHDGRLALGCGRFAIHFDSSLKTYVLKESGEVLFSDVSMSKLLDLAPEIIFDAAAATIQPSWNGN